MASDDTTHHEEFERQAVERDLVADAHLEYEGWLEATGLDDSFVGMPAQGIPGTADLYAAAVRVLERENAPKA